MHHNTYRHGNEQARILLCNAQMTSWIVWGGVVAYTTAAGVEVTGG